MAASTIQSGQVWRMAESGQNWLVTKVYSEVFASYAILRRVGGTEAEVRRLKIEKTSDGFTLPGFIFTQDADPF